MSASHQNTVASPVLAIRLDEQSGVMYVGEASLGASESAAVWRIKSVGTSGTITTVRWADGNAEFDNVWNNRAALSYV